MKRKIAVLGGDQRQICLAQFLREDGWDVVTWGLEKADTTFAVSLDQALCAEIMVLPLPICRGNDLNLPLSDNKLPCDVFWKQIHADCIVFGGMIAKIPEGLRGDHRFTLLDYYDREEVQIYHALPTAEGAIMRAMECTKRTLHGSSCLVVGYGRIGKVLAHRLHSMGANVTVSARKRSDLAWIDVFGYRAVQTQKISERIGEYDLIFNTVPEIVMDAGCLKAVKQGCLLVELASLPGGMDRKSVKEYNLRVVEERGLPGIVAPETSAKLIRDTIYHILDERGEMV